MHNHFSSPFDQPLPAQSASAASAQVVVTPEPVEPSGALTESEFERLRFLLPPDLLLKIERLNQRARSRFLVCGDVTLDLEDGVLFGRAGQCQLTRYESRLLRLLMEQRGQELTELQILLAVWKRERQSNLVAVYVSYLRARLRQVGSALSITKPRHGGYAITDGSRKQ
jgi:DNA-binding response OmpR family regulator